MRVAVIPLRGGSKGIPDKNIKDMCGMPLCFWAMKAAATSNAFEKIIISTDCKKIKGVVTEIMPALDEGGKLFQIIDRPEKLARDDTPTFPVIRHALEGVKYDTVTTIQATNPMIDCYSLWEANELMDDDNYDSMLSAVRFRRLIWKKGKPLNFKVDDRPRRQEIKGQFMENGAFYITRKRGIEWYKKLLGGNVGIYEMLEETAIELDEPGDWVKVERAMNSAEVE